MAQITIRKDNIAPSITINEPNNAEEFDITPIFDITIDETNLDEFWYTIDDGANNYTITELVGTIDSGAWSAAPSGTITIRFYARDLAGNIGTRFVIIVKTSSPSQPPPEIPGYHSNSILPVYIDLKFTKPFFIKSANPFPSQDGLYLSIDVNKC